MTKPELVKKAQGYGIVLSGNEKVSDLNLLVADYEAKNPDLAKPDVSEPVKAEMTLEEALAIVETPNVKIRREGLHEGSRSANQLKYYAAHEFARTILPKGAGDPKDAVETYCVNDLMFFILKGVGVKLPIDVVMGFENASQTTLQALEKDSLKNTPKELEQ